MMRRTGGCVTEHTGTMELLSDWRAGSYDARDRLIARLHAELSQIAAARLRHERNASLSTGDLLNDVVLKLMRMERVAPVDRQHFVALASRMMRNILVDHARGKRAARRDHVRVELSTAVEKERIINLDELDSALVRLGAIDPQLVEIVEMRYFGGMTILDVAGVTGMSEPTVKRRWQTARAWLTDALSNPLPR